MVSIKNIMSEKVITISKNSTTRDAASLMIDNDVSSLLVTENKKPVAIILENDLIKNVFLKKKNSSNYKVKDLMHKKFKIISSSTKYNDVLKDIKEQNIKSFPVVNDYNELIGLVTESDIVEATRDFTRMHHIVQEVILAVFGLVTAFFLFFFSPLGTSIFGTF